MIFSGNLHALLKVETLKTLIRDNFESAWAVFEMNTENIASFICLETRIHFQTEFEKIPQARGQAPGPKGVFVQTQFGNEHVFFKIVCKRDPCFICF